MARVDKMTVSEGNTGELTSGEGFRQIATF
jgi:hypothetical protein